MNIIIVFLILIFITIIGYAFISYFNLLGGYDKLLKISYSFGLGVALVCFQLYIYSRLNIPWTRGNLIIPWVILILVSLIKNGNLLFTLPKIPKLKKIDLLLILLIFFCIFYTVFEALIRPPVAWDSWAAWLFQAKVFFLDGRISPELLRHFNFYYPILYYLLDTFFFILLGKFDDFSILLISSAFYFFQALLFFGFAKQRYGLRRSILFTLLLVSVQNLIRHGGRMEAGLADLPLGFFAFCGITLLFDYMKTSNVKTFAVLGIFLGFTALIKSEGLPLSLWIGLFAIIHIYRNKLYNQLIFLLFWIISVIDWEVFKRSNGIIHYFSNHFLSISITKTLSSFTGTLKELINIKSWNLLWIVYFYTIFLSLKKYKNKELLILNFVIIAQISFYVLIYVLTNGNSPQSSIERLLIHLAPMAMLEMVILTDAAGFGTAVKSLAFGNGKVMEFVNNFISWVNRN